MGRAAYLIKRIAKMHYRDLFKTVSQIHKKSGKGRIWLFRDIVHCGVRYGAGYSDYRLCEFYHLTEKQRETYVTRGINNQLVKLLNSPDYYYVLADKTVFNELFSEYIGRGWLNMSTATPASFLEFIKDRETIISKPRDAACGQGVEKLLKSNFSSAHDMYEYLEHSGSGLIEDYIVQHPEISRLYPHSVNTLRIVTILKDDVAHLIYAFIRIGNGGRVVDNINSGGMTAPIDPDTGIIQHVAFDKDMNLYETHPETGVRIPGLQIPFWRESVEICKKSARKIPNVAYVAWDVAVTENGPIFVEANHFPGHDILQMPPHVPDKIGMLPRYREVVDLKLPY